MTETPFRAHGQSVADMEIENLRARLAAAEARAEELAAIVESQRVMLAAADRYRALLDLETWMARAERAEALLDEAVAYVDHADYDILLAQRIRAAAAERQP